MKTKEMGKGRNNKEVKSQTEQEPELYIYIYSYSYGCLSRLANASEQANSIFICLPWSKQISSECLNRLAASPTE